MTAVDFVMARIPKDEGFRQYPYNDRTGARVTCITPDAATSGNLTWLYGLNLETEGCQELGEHVARWKLGKIEIQLAAFAWYTSCNDIRRSVLLEIAFNAGPHGLLHFPHMLSAIANGDWATAKAECHAEDPRLAARYAMLADILFRGEA